MKYLRPVYFQACSASGLIHFGQDSVPSLLHLGSYTFSPHMRSTQCCSCTHRASSPHPQSRASHEPWEAPLFSFTILQYLTTYHRPQLGNGNENHLKLSYHINKEKLSLSLSLPPDDSATLGYGWFAQFSSETKS